MINILNNKDLFLDYVSAKAASPDYPLDRFSIDFAMFGKSSEFFVYGTCCSFGSLDRWIFLNLFGDIAIRQLINLILI